MVMDEQGVAAYVQPLNIGRDGHYIWKNLWEGKKCSTTFTVSYEEESEESQL
jgi:hypothetical protein